MLKEKIKEYINSNGNNKKKIENLLTLIVILIFIRVDRQVISIKFIIFVKIFVVWQIVKYYC